MKEKYTLIVLDVNGVSKEFTDYDSYEDAQQEAIRIGQEGWFSSDPNGNGAIYYPPHRVHFIQIIKQSSS